MIIPSCRTSSDQHNIALRCNQMQQGRCLPRGHYRTRLRPIVSLSTIGLSDIDQAIYTFLRLVSSSTSKRDRSGNTARHCMTSLGSKMDGPRSTRYVVTIIPCWTGTDPRQGMIKMYNAEVLSKFPVVQHFPFGSLFRWERDASAAAPAVSPHARAQPRASGMSQSSMKAPRASAPAAGNMPGSTAAPWASTARPVGKPGGTATPWAQPMSATSASMTRGAPGAAAGRPSNTSSMPPSTYSNVTSSQRR